MTTEYINPASRSCHERLLFKQPLYRVRFLQRDLWADYAGHPADVVEVEIYQHWLEAEERGP